MRHWRLYIQMRHDVKNLKFQNVHSCFYVVLFRFFIFCKKKQWYWPFTLKNTLCCSIPNRVSSSAKLCCVFLSIQHGRGGGAERKKNHKTDFGSVRQSHDFFFLLPRTICIQTHGIVRHVRKPHLYLIVECCIS